ncbi:related to mitochondrial cytosolically directed NADH dehydrogenase [Phialocephala subalpina]|uniref:Related to mitochondrial cytosolically directed NADH dehydrogenase n=1 Tax=Phialocephala subalpina TaxID=576137 RepID=A0A1L7WBQ5_9HELO|nr:related to mitochondrial cytosolically directed NADH dehydrogenase [Phialocephala subalpina]
MSPTTRSHNSPTKPVIELPTSLPSSAPSTTSSSSTLPSDSKSSPHTSISENGKPTLAILGTGWAGWTLAQDLGHSSSFLQQYNLVVLSPTRTMALTPLLASAATGIFDFRIAEEPIRRLSLGKDVVKYQVWCTGVDVEKRVVRCRAAVGSNGREKTNSGLKEHSDGDGEDGNGEFEVGYDKLILAPGSEVNTFDTLGVKEHCLFMKSVAGAMALRERILDCFELASLPTCSVEQKRKILHFMIVGGGPTGVELAAEIDELVQDHGFESGVMKVKEDGEVSFGAAVWCTGNKAGSVVEGLEVRKNEAGQRLLTDKWLRLLRKGEDNEVVDGVYALGDAADIEGGELPTTAEVAVQKAKWLAKHLVAGEEGK